MSAVDAEERAVVRAKVEREVSTAVPRVMAQDVAGVNANPACAALTRTAAARRGMRPVSTNALRIAADAVEMAPVAGLREVVAPAAHPMDAVRRTASAATDAHARAACVIRIPTAVQPSGTASAWVCAPTSAVPVAGVQAAVAEETTHRALEIATDKHLEGVGAHRTA